MNASIRSRVFPVSIVRFLLALSFGASVVHGLTPDQVDGLSLWLKADAGVEEAAGDPAENGDAVEYWRDQSGNGNDVYQNSSGNQPLYRTNIGGFNGNPCLRFRDDTDWMRTGSNASVRTAFFVFNNLGGGPEMLVGCWTGNRSVDMFANAASNLVSMDGTSNQDGRFALDGNYFSGWAENHTTTVTTNTTLFCGQWQQSFNARFIGARDNNGSAQYPFDGDLAEVILYDRELTIADRQIVEEYLSAKYGLGLELVPGARNVSAGGTVEVGQLLTGSYTYTDPNGDPEGLSSFQWYRANDASGTGQTAIAGATGISYGLTAGDEGLYISFAVTPQPLTGRAPGGETQSDWAGPVAALSGEVAPVAANVAVSGRARVNEQLVGSYSYSDENGDTEGSTTFQWYRADDGAGTNSVAIGGATGLSHVLTSADSGKYLFFEVTPAAQTGTSPGTAVRSAGYGMILGPAPFTIDNCVLWLDASAIPAQGDNTDLANWPDQSGLYAEVSQLGEANRRPHYRAARSEFNNKPAVQFRNDNQYMNLVGSAATRTAFIVFSNVANGVQTIFGRWTGNRSVDLFLDRQNSLISFDGTTNPDGRYAFDGTDYSDWGENFDAAIPNNGAILAIEYQNSQPFSFLGARNNNGTPQNLMDMVVAEIIVFDAVLSDGVRSQVETYLSDKYDLALQLPPTASNLQVSGTPQAGQLLTGSYDYYDANGDPEGASTFQWYRSDNFAGTNKAAIAGATGISYAPVADDIDKYLSLEVTAAAASGQSPAGPVESYRVGPVAPSAGQSAPVASNVVVSGVIRAGKQLVGSYTYTDADGDPEGSSTFQWYRADDAAGTNSSAIAGATGITYVLSDQDSTKFVFFEVTPIAQSGTTTGNAVKSYGFGKIRGRAPFESDSCQLWLDATRIPAQGDNTDLTSWIDWSDFNRTVQQNGLSSYRPHYRVSESDFDNLPGVHFRNNTQYMEIVNGVPTKTAFFVFTGIANNLESLLSRWTGNRHVTLACDRGNTTVTFDGSINPRGRYAWDGMEFSTYQENHTTSVPNGVTILAVEYQDQQSFTHLGAQFNGNSVSNHLDARLAEVIIFGNTISAGVRAQVESYLSDKYNLLLQLPPSVSNVEISGTPEIGSLLTGSYSYYDANGDPEGTSSFKWYRADDLSGTNKTEIPGATGTAYAPVAADEDKYLSFEVTAHAASGKSPAGPVESYRVGPVTVAVSEVPPIASAVTVSGVARVGEQVVGAYTYFDNDGDAEGSSTFQWYRADDAAGTNIAQISGATSITYILDDPDSNKFVFFEVTPYAQTGTSPGSAVRSNGYGSIRPRPPFDTDSCVLWLDASRIDPQGDNTDLSTWNDWSNFGANVQQSGLDGYKPHYRTSVGDLNGKPAVQFRNNTQYMEIVGNVRTRVAFFVFTGLRNNRETFLSRWTGNRHVSLDCNRGINELSFDGSTNPRGRFARDGMDFSIYQENHSTSISNGPTILAVEYQDEQPMDILGARNNGGSISEHLDAYVAEVIIFCNSISTGVRSQVESYLSQKYGLLLQLPPSASNVQVTGTPAVGELLTGSYVYSDANGDPEGASSFQWYRSDDLAGTNKAAISGATGTGYAPVIADSGKYLSFEVTVAAATGRSPGGPVESYRVGPVTVLTGEAAPIASNVTVSGFIRVGRQLVGSYSYSDVNGDPEGASTFRWLRADDAAGTNIAPIPGATGLSYILADVDSNQYVFFEVTPVAQSGIAAGNPALSNGFGKIRSRAPFDTDSCSLWLDAGRIDPQADNSDLDFWFDWGDYNVAVQQGGVDGYKPHYRASIAALNNKPAVQFRNNTQFFEMVGGVQTKVAFFVLYNLSNDEESLLSRWTGNRHVTTAVDRSSNQVSFDGSTNPRGRFGFDGLAWSTYDENHTTTIPSQATLLAIEYQDAQNMTFLGARNNGGTPQEFLNAYCPEVILFRNSITDGVRSQVESYLSQKYGLILQLAPSATNVEITGTPQVGQLLTGSYTYSDANNDPEGATTFRWLRCDDLTKTNLAAISGATALTYAPTPADTGKFLVFEVTPAAAGGKSPGGTVQSYAIGPVTAVSGESAPLASNVGVSGRIRVGKMAIGTYTYFDADDDPEGVSTFRWLRADDAAGTGISAIAGATSINYVLTSADSGKYLFFEVTPVATSGTLTGTPVRSAAFGSIRPEAEFNTDSCVLWLDASRIDPQPNNSDLTYWVDWSDFTRTVQQAGLDNIKPHYRTSEAALNNKPAVFFNNDRTYMEIVGGVTAKTAFIVYQGINNDISTFLSRWTGNRHVNLDLEPGGNTVSFDGSTNPRGRYAFDGMAWSVYQEDHTTTINRQTTIMAAEYQDAQDFTFLGARNNGGTPQNHLDGMVAEVILFSNSIDEGVRQQVEAYLSEKYGHVLQLPPGASSVSITGTPEIGQLLTGSYTYSDPNGDAEGTSLFKWYRMDDLVGTNRTAIAGATALTYAPVNADSGKYLTFEVTAVAVTGRSPGGPVESYPVGRVTKATGELPPVASNVAVNGRIRVGKMLIGSYDYSDANGDPEATSTFRWLRADDQAGTNMSAISGANEITYILADADSNKFVFFEVTPVPQSGDSGSTATRSNGFGMIRSAPPFNTDSCVLWLDAGRIPFQSNNSDLEIWPDWSDFNRRVEQSELNTMKPHYLTQYGALNDHPVVRFQNNTQYIKLIDGVGARSAFFVYANLASGRETFISRWTGNRYVSLYLDDGNNTLSFDGSTNLRGRFAFDGDVYSAYQENHTALSIPTDATLLAAEYQNQQDFTFLGAENNGGNPQNFADVCLAEVILFSNAASQAVRDQVETYLSQKYGLGLQVPPVASDVLVSGKDTVGYALTATYTYSDANGDAEGSSQFQWYRSDDLALTNRTAIAGATGMSYALAEADTGKYITFEVTPYAVSGKNPGGTVESYPVGPVAPVAGQVPPVASNVTISGQARVDQTVTASYEYFDANGDLEGSSVYRWYRADDKNGTGIALISGATSQNYVVAPDDSGKYIFFEVLPTAQSGATPGTAVQSPGFGAIQPPAPFDTDNLELWLDAGAIPSQSNNSDLEQWPDKSGYNRTVLRGLPESTRPHYMTSIGSLNNNPAVRFAGNAQYLDMPDGVNTKTVFLVYDNLGSGAETVLGRWTGNRYVSLYLHPGGNTISFDGNTNPRGRYAYNAGAFSGYNENHNGVTVPTGPSILTAEYQNTQPFTHFGARNNNGTIENGFDGDIAEMIVFSSSVTSTVRSEVETYLSDKYGIGIGELAPVATGVSITGAVEVDSTVNGTYVYSDANADPEGASTFQWYRSDEPFGVNKVAIPGATGTSLLLTIDHQGLYIFFEVTPVAQSGSSPGATVLSPAGGPVFGPEETPQWERSSLGPIKGGALTETRIYVGTGGYRKLLSINLADGSTKWEYLTTGLGDVGQPTYSYDADNDTYKIVATAGSYAVGRQDDGTASSQLFAPVYLGTQTGTPYIGIGDTTFYVPYDDKLTRRNIDDGTEAAGWPQTVANLSPRADIVVEQDMVFCATSDGKVHKYDTDGTPLGTFSGIAGNASVELPLFLDRTGLLVTPSSAKVYCVDINTMSEKWNVDLSAANTGPLFAKYGDVAYVAADRYVERITLGSAPAGVDWSYDAATAVESGPIALDSIVYFGTTSGRYFAIDDDQTSVTRVERWPYTKASGNANAGPWVSDGNRLVIFGTEGQYLSAFRLVE